MTCLTQRLHQARLPALELLVSYLGKEVRVVFGRQEIEVITPRFAQLGQPGIQRFEMPQSVPAFGPIPVGVVALGLDFDHQDGIRSTHPDEVVRIEVLVGGVRFRFDGRFVGIGEGVAAPVGHLHKGVEQFGIGEQHFREASFRFMAGVVDVPGGFERR